MAQEQWYAVYEVAIGRLVSEGTVVATPLPPGLAFKAISRPDDSTVWNPTSLDYIQKPPVLMADRVADFAEDSAVKLVLLKLSLGDRQTLRDALAALLGRYRFRFTDQPKGIN